MRRNVLMLVLAAGSLWLWAADDAAVLPSQGVTAAPLTSTFAITIPQMLSYQGKLTDSLGNPVPDGNYQLTFRLYTQETGGSPFWTEAQTIMVKNGLFSALLGAVTPISSVPDAGVLYLSLQVGTGSELTPRLRIVSSAYAYLAGKADTANYAMSGTSDNAWVRGTPDSVLFTIRQLGIARGGSNNMLYGDYRYTHTNFGVACTTGAPEQNYSYCTVAGGHYNKASGNYATVGGGIFNRANHEGATVGGGLADTAGGSYATVAGGIYNMASGNYATVAGGSSNTASGIAATVAGGGGNTASGNDATVGGGYANTASGYYATVAGGYGDTCAGAYGLACGYKTRVKDAADYTFAFGENCSTSTARAVVFYHSGAATKLGVGVQNPTHNIDVQGGAYCNGTNWVNASSRRLKKDIRGFTPEELRAVLEELIHTQVVRYRYKSDESGEEHIGVIAEEAPELLATPERDGINTGDAIGFLLAAVQAVYEELQQEKINNQQLRQKVEALKAELQKGR